MRMTELITRKKNGGELTATELRFLCNEFAAGRLPDYQVAAWLMAVCLRGMSEAETLALTLAMADSGATLDWSRLPRPPVDKHSTGGVGDKTSLVLVPLMAAAGIPFVKMSGRGLGHTGGTLDKLESIPGFSTALPLAQMREQVERIGCALVGQSPELVPADGALYALRDATATVESVPLIASSIMSKKLAAGALAMVLDVKYGAGAFMPSAEAARELARTMVQIGLGAGRQVRAVLSPMQEPLGRTVGNALEVQEAIETLNGAGPADLWELTLELGTHLMVLAGAATAGDARTVLVRLRGSGAAARKFAELIRAQGGDPSVMEDTDLLPKAPIVTMLNSPGPGERWVASADARGVASAALELGAGRRTKGDTLDLSVGVRLLAKGGDRVGPGQPLAEIHARDAADAARAAEMLRHAFRWSEVPVPQPEHRYEVIPAEGGGA